MKRIEANDPVAICQMGNMRYREGDYSGAFEYFSKAVNWVMWERMVIYHLCIGMGMVLRKTRKKRFITWKRLLLVGTPMRGTISVV
jgi:hypothetical protein